MATRKRFKKKTYIKNGGRGCGVCGHWDLNGGEVSIECGAAIQEVTCSNCGASWTDVYILHHVEEIDLSEVKNEG